MINATREIISISNRKTKIIPGHGPLSNKKQLIAFNKMLKDVKNLAISAMKDGRSAKQLAVSDSFLRINKKWGGGFLTSSNS
jgi:5,10-methylenetetrahydrofolate reductase